MSNSSIPKPGRFEKKWAKLNLAPTTMSGTADLLEAELIVMNVWPKLAITGKLLTRTARAPFGCKEVVIKHGEREDRFSR